MSEGHKIGIPPGTLVHVGERKIEDVMIEAYVYDKDSFDHHPVVSLSELVLDPSKRTWIDVRGIHDDGIIREFGDRFGIHPLVLEDIMNSRQRPKIEEYEDYLFIVLKGILPLDDGYIMEHVSILLFSNLVITFQEVPENSFANLLERFEKSKGRIRADGSDYLVYAIIDTVVDRYFLVVENLSEKIEDLEYEIVENLTDGSLARIQMIKKDITEIRKTVNPHRDIAYKLERIENDLINDNTNIYIRDVYDHLVQIIENIDTYREILSGLLEIHLSNLSNKMNEVMKVLTVIATIFIPLSFIAGVFGMNFANMPELGWKYSYPITLFSMLFIGLIMMMFFRGKKWI